MGPHSRGFSPPCSPWHPRSLCRKGDELGITPERRQRDASFKTAGETARVRLCFLRVNRVTSSGRRLPQPVQNPPPRVEPPRPAGEQRNPLASPHHTRGWTRRVCFSAARRSAGPEAMSASCVGSWDTRGSARLCAGRASICGAPRQLPGHRRPRDARPGREAPSAPGTRPLAVGSVRGGTASWLLCPGLCGPPRPWPMAHAPLSKHSSQQWRRCRRPRTPGSCLRPSRLRPRTRVPRSCRGTGVWASSGLCSSALPTPAPASPPRPSSPTVGHGEGVEHWPHRTKNEARDGRRGAPQAQGQQPKPWAARVSGAPARLPVPEGRQSLPPGAAPTPPVDMDIPPRHPAQSPPPMGGGQVSARKPPSSQARTFSPEPPRRASVEGPQVRLAGVAARPGSHQPAMPPRPPGPRLPAHWARLLRTLHLQRLFWPERALSSVGACVRPRRRTSAPRRHRRPGPQSHPSSKAGVRVTEESLTAGDGRAWPAVWVLRGSSLFYT